MRSLTVTLELTKEELRHLQQSAALERRSAAEQLVSLVQQDLAGAQEFRRRMRRQVHAQEREDEAGETVSWRSGDDV